MPLSAKRSVPQIINGCCPDVCDYGQLYSLRSVLNPKNLLADFSPPCLVCFVDLASSQIKALNHVC